MSAFEVNWQIVLALGTLSGLFVVAIKPLLHLNKTLVTLDLTLRKQSEALDQMRIDNNRTHEKICEQLTNHEERIGKVEYKLEKK
jgi:hypothetical protein